MRLRAFLIMLTILLASSSIHAQQNQFEGIWEALGLGFVFAIEDDAVTVYEISPTTCFVFADGNIDANVMRIATVLGTNLTFEMNPDDDGLIAQGEILIRLAQKETLLEHCANGGTPQTDDPIANFEALWGIMDSYYALFHTFEVDWQAAYDTYRPQITSGTSEDDLWRIFTEMLAPLKDGHLYLTSGTRDFSGDSPDFPNTSLLNAALVNSYLEAPLESALDRAFRYGRFQDHNIGYIQITTFENGAIEYPVLRELYGSTIDQILFAFDGVDGLIIDVRANGGGSDDYALAVANRFTTEPILAIEVSALHNSEYVDYGDFIVTPLEERAFDWDISLTENVVVLTSGGTFSAAGNFVLMMRVLPNVTIVGETTGRAFSNSIPHFLPNGWLIMYSPQLFADANGNIFEAVGVPPDVEVTLDESALRIGNDPQIDAAIDILIP